MTQHDQWLKWWNEMCDEICGVIDDNAEFIGNTTVTEKIKDDIINIFEYTE